MHSHTRIEHRAVIDETLAAHDYNSSVTAKQLGLNRSKRQFQ